jgi:hypothetical protein
MLKIAGVVASVLCLALLVACGGGGSSPTAATPPAPQKAVIKVLMDPNPVQAVATGNGTYPWDFRFNIQLSDSGGVPFIVTSMETSVASTLTGSVLTTTDQNPFVGVKVPAYGQETRQFHMGGYRMEFFTRQAKVTVKINFVDDRGNASVYNGTVSVMHVGEPVHLGE